MKFKCFAKKVQYRFWEPLKIEGDSNYVREFINLDFGMLIRWLKEICEKYKYICIRLSELMWIQYAYIEWSLNYNFLH